MSNEKLEPRLVEAIEAQKRRAESQGRSPRAVDEADKFEVTISHYERVSAQEEAVGGAGLGELSERTERSQASIVDRIRAVAPDAPIKQHTLANAITTTLTPAEMARVAEIDEVSLVRLERLDHVTTMNDSVSVIEIRDAWEEFRGAGRGVRVAVLDSGVDADHPALSGKVVDQVSTAAEPVSIPGAHGTHVAGTIASNDPVFRGVAFQASLINIKVLTAAGFGQPQFVIDGLEQAVRRNADVANLSLGWSEIFHGWVCNDADCILCQAADNAVRLGVTVVVAAGNEGSAAGPGQSNIRHPGAARRVITVGAVDKAKQLAPFSSIGPSSGRLSPTSDIRLTKPDLAGPGVDITSTVPGGGFLSLSGTSMASPHVAGLAALVLEQNPGARPLLVKKLLESSCEDLPYDPNSAGHGLINGVGALLRPLAKASNL
jgi:serine protease AprX